MTVFKIESSYVSTSNSQSSKLLRSTLILFAASSLFACSQPESSASTASTVKAEHHTAATSVMSKPVSNPDLLKNISATVYKDVNCGCCKDWISHAEDNGLGTTAHDVADVALFKDRYGVPTEMRSCHTAITTDGYVFEGHVPAKYMAQFLENPPVQALGLAVPGMPVGSPGMEYQNKFAPYQIMQLNKDGTTQVYADIESTEQQL
ncbi:MULTISPECIES: DUF411 domain-containing protein [unclassified Psychrobacter]|uniref:DUF411 domain-containing protein n=1 Tax=unclassified Psychrobacter TaxID=196806 RepID=UPI000B7CB1AC|nr:MULTISPECIES: DUF411 domain-containing protein [unclassified Psychrobacter]MDE4453903.1 DUF411 domain-containing protein [Psychrobacter sp. DAB_AL62B]OXL26195.1 ATP-binding protein [Psychrobacter sp. DAB_AL32B]